MDKVLFETLNKIGVPCHLIGRKYIAQAVKCVLETHLDIYYITKTLYPKLAKMNCVSCNSIERGIRYAISCTVAESTNEALYEVFGNCINKKSKPNNGKFVAGLAEYVRLQINE